MIEVEVGGNGRFYQVRPIYVLWSSNMANLRTMTIHSCCFELRYSWLPLLYEAGHCPAETSHTVIINNIEHNYVVAKYRLYDVGQLNFLGQSFALFCVVGNCCPLSISCT